MLFYKNKIKKNLLSTATFFNYIGFYICLLLVINAGYESMSRIITVPVRILIGVCLIGMLVLGTKKRLKGPVLLFSIFILLYVVRVLYDMIENRMAEYYLTGGQVLLFLLLFTILPFFILSRVKLRLKDYDLILKTLLFSSLLFSIIAFTLYKKFIGEVGILASSTAGEDVLGHLALAYSSGLGIGVGLFYLLYNKMKPWRRIYVLIIIGLSVILFILASGRGAAVGILISFILLFFSQKNIKRKFRNLFFIAIICLLVIWLINLFGSSLLERFSSINFGNSQGPENDQDIRLLMWKQAFSQFLDHPVFGSGLVIQGFGGYTHEIFIEVLMTTGILGFIPFILLIWHAFKKTFMIFRYTPSYSWVGVLFVISFSQNIFSGAIYSNSWIWFSMALLFSFDHKLKKGNKLSYYSNSLPVPKQNNGRSEVTSAAK